jgi:D-sedoheptulose 7-phosphate isomerase
MDEFLLESIRALKRTKFNLEELKFFIFSTRYLGGSIYTIGNGGSASTASHFSSDLSNLRFKSFCLSDNISLLTSLANDYDYNQIFTRQVEKILSKNDLVIGISCSGKSMNVVNAIRFANFRCPTIVFTAFDGGYFIEDVKPRVLIHVPTNNIYIAEGLHSLLLHDIINNLKV